RVGECLALSWSDIDFNNETVSVYKTILQNGTLQNSTKTKESTRVVAFDKEISHSLKMWQSSQSTQRKVVSLSNQYVFSLNSCNLIYAYESLKLQNHFKNANVSNIGFHGFRHTHASLLMNADVNPKEIQLRLGHADYSITMNIYSHLAKDKKKDTAEKFSNILKAL
ncbi:MAG: site-specific integrase, partial [Lactococcus chungangensis]